MWLALRSRTLKNRQHGLAHQVPVANDRSSTASSRSAPRQGAFDQPKAAPTAPERAARGCAASPKMGKGAGPQTHNARTGYRLR